MRCLVILLALACNPAEPDPHGAEDEHIPAEHSDEPAHGPAPRTVRISKEVMAAAGVVTAPVGKHPISPTARLHGEIVADPDRYARVGARLPGIVDSVAVQAGDEVDRGQVLAVIRAPDLQSLRASASALQARATSARGNADRLSALVQARMASTQEAVAARAEADALAAEARAARERLRAIGVKRSSRGPILFEVRSPLAGVVTDRNVVAGDPVTEGTVVATVVSLDEVWFVAHVFERDVARVREHARVSVRLNAYPDEAFEGEVVNVSARVDPDARTLSARVPLTNRDSKLRLGLFGTAFVAVGDPPTEPRLAVPQSAVTEVLGESAVFVQHADDDFELHEVKLGDADTEFVEIVHGLREGEQVVVQGAFTLKSALIRHTIGGEEH